MRRLALTAVLTAIAAQAAAQTQTSPIETTGSARVDGLFRTSELDGADIYSIDPATGYDWTGTAELEGISEEWEEIGEVESMVVDTRGQIVGVVADVGGFLGIGDKDVLIPISEIRVAPGQEGEMAFVTRLGEELLEQWPALGDDYWE